MPVTIRPIIVTADIHRLLAFYTELLGAQENVRHPDDVIPTMEPSSTSASPSATPSSA